MTIGVEFQAAYGDGTDQTVSIGAASAQSAAFGDNTFMVEVTVNGTDCHIAFGDDPTASTDNHWRADGWNQYKRVEPGQKLAVIQDSGAGSGTVYINEIER
jgi:hypothetical protein